MTPRTEPRPPPAQYGPTLTAQDAAQDDRERRKRSSGWSKYFATSQPTGPNGLSHLPSAYAKTNTQSDGSLYSTDRGSHPSHIPSSAIVPPLDIDFGKTIDGQRLSHVAMGSPSFNDSREDLARRGSTAPEGQKGLIVDPKRPRSHSESLTSSYNRSTMSSTMTTDFFADSATPWTPTSNSFKDHLISRPPSSVYGPSEQRMPSRGKGAGFFPGSGSSYRPQRSPKSKTGFSTSEIKPPKVKPVDDRDSTVTVFPEGIPSAYYSGGDRGQQTKNGLSMSSMKPPKVPAAEGRDSTVTLFPRGVPSAYYSDRERSQQAKPVNSDLGWLNLKQ